MSKVIPQIMKYMSTQPHTVNHDQTLKQAQVMMREYRIRHLPVLNAGKLIGILTEKDINLVLTFKTTKSEEIKVAEVCTEQPYTTTPDAKLNEVVAYMAGNRFGSAVVLDNDKVVGIFTEVDALLALSELLESRLKT
jgi:acetoin utilization protein AcuB